MTTGGILFLALFIGLAMVLMGLLAWADKRTHEK